MPVLVLVPLSVGAAQNGQEHTDRNTWFCDKPLWMGPVGRWALWVLWARTLALALTLP